MKRLHSGFTISYTLFFVFCGLSLLVSYNAFNLPGAGASSKPPENLRSAAESFKIQYARESATTTTPEYADSMSWSQLNEKLNRYANELEARQDKERFQRSLFSWLYLGSAISMCVFTFRLRRSEKANPQN